MTELKRYRTVVFDSIRWNGFEFRPDDIVISTPPKCGTTWTQMLCALLIFDTTEFDRPLAQISPWLDMQLYPRDQVVALLEAQEHRRFIKTHAPLDGVPFDERVTYLCVARDPRDVSVSWANHLANIDVAQFMATRDAAVGNDDLAEFGMHPPGPDAVAARTPHDDLVDWLEQGPDEGMSLARMLAHLQTFWDRRHESNVALFHYADYSADLVGQMRRLADVLGIEVSDARLAELAPAATFEAMKRSAGKVGPNTDINLWRDTGEFFHRGSSGQWRDVFRPEDLERYDERVADLIPPDLADWAHHGWLAADLPDPRQRRGSLGPVTPQ